MAAGFSTPSHFSESFLRMFDLTATALAGAEVSIVLVEDAARLSNRPV